MWSGDGSILWRMRRFLRGTTDDRRLLFGPLNGETTGRWLLDNYRRFDFFYAICEVLWILLFLGKKLGKLVIQVDCIRHVTLELTL